MKSDPDPDPDADDPYAVLGVPKDADLVAIKSAYRRLARQLHPDSNPDAEAEARFQAVKAAYSDLRERVARVAGSDSSGVSERTILILLAEVRVGSVDVSFAGHLVHEESAGGPDTAGLVCVGERGLAFVPADNGAGGRPSADSVRFVSYANIASLSVGSTSEASGATTATVSRSDVVIGARIGEGLVLRLRTADASALRTQMVEARARSAAAPGVSTPAPSPTARFQNWRLGRRSRRSERRAGRQTGRRAAGGQDNGPVRLPRTNGWWIVVALGVAIALVLGAVLIGG